MLHTRAKPAVPTAAPSISSSPARLSTATKQRTALIVAPQWVGDAVLSLPLIEELHPHYSEIDVLAVPAVAAVYRCSPSVRAVQEAPFSHGRLQWGLRRSIARGLRSRYDIAIVLPNSLKSALIPWLARIPIRRGMIGESRYLLINDRRHPPVMKSQPPRSDVSSRSHRPSMLAHYLQLAESPKAVDAIDAMGLHRPKMVLPKAISTPTAAGPRLVLCPGAEYGPAKQWPAEHFAQVAAAWVRQGPGHVVTILGSPKERLLGESILAQAQSLLRADHVGQESDRVENLAGQTSLLQAFGWIAHSSLVISNDSGLMHAAAALDVPVVALFGSTDPGHTPAHSPKATIISLQLACSPCFSRICPLGTTACLSGIAPDAVIRLFPMQQGN